MGRVDWLGRPAPKAARLLLALGVTAWAGWQLLPWLLSDPLALIATGHLKDDAFFYSTLAERVLVEGFFSLDGVTETNGFQPLWMAILVCLKALMPDASSLGLLRGMSWFFYLTSKII